VAENDLSIAFSMPITNPSKEERIAYTIWAKLINMRRKTKESLFILVVAIAAVIVLWFVFSRLRIVVFALMPWWVLGLLILIATAVLFIALDQFIDRWR
jgi:hypothetical protein